MDAIQEWAAQLAEEARQANQRRFVVIHGSRSATGEIALEVLQAAGIDRQRTVLVGDEPIEGFAAERVGLERSAELLGTTQAAIVYDAHRAFDPDVVGRTVGAVDGGGLYLLLVPPLDDWPQVRDGFDETLAVPPYEGDEVGGHFRRRVIASLEDRDGVAVVDADEARVDQDGRTGQRQSGARSSPSPPSRASFPDRVYEASLTVDQAETVQALELMLDPGTVTVVEADRGRGKSSAAGLAAVGLLERGYDVLVTAPERANADEVFARVRELAGERDVPIEEADGERRWTVGDGQIGYRPPAEAAETAGRADAVIVDEAAGLPVHVLETLLEAGPPICFASTIHGYEGAGRGFSVRFQARLDETDRPVHRVRLDEPIRFAPGDPLEAWSFEALGLDAEPAEAEDLGSGQPAEATYRAPSAEELASEEDLLGEVFGLLVLAHYRTRPSDLARLLDGPNVSVRCLTLEGHVVSVALMAREGGLPEATRRRMYEGERVTGNMIPDVLTSQLRDAEAAEPTGWRVLRIATHPARRREGLASHLLAEIEAEADTDWLGTSYGATPGLLAFWRQQGYRAVHLATRRNPASGEHSVVMLDPLTPAGRDLTERSEAWLARRIGSVLTDALDELDPDIVRGTLRSLEQAPALELSDREWRVVAASAHGPGVFDVAPRPFRQLVLHHVVEQEAGLQPEQERLLVRKVLQAQPWEAIVEAFEVPSKRMAMRALGDALKPLVDTYGGKAAAEEAERYR